MIVLARHLSKVDHLKVSAYSWSLALSSIHTPPLLLNLYKHGHLAECTRQRGAGVTMKNIPSVHTCWVWLPKSYSVMLVIACLTAITYNVGNSELYWFIAYKLKVSLKQQHVVCNDIYIFKSAYTNKTKQINIMTHQPLLAREMEMELRSRLHLDSLMIASQLVPGVMTTNSRIPYLSAKTQIQQKIQFSITIFTSSLTFRTWSTNLFASLKCGTCLYFVIVDISLLQYLMICVYIMQ